MKKILLVFLMLCCSPLFAFSFNKLVFFGDSLSDNGNLYALLLNTLPQSPPYYKGRFSNGPTWAEELARHYYDRSYIDSKNYAFGGATAVFHLPTDRFISPTTLNMEVDKYLLEHAFADKSKTLFSVWIGGNDYLYYNNSDNADTLAQNVVDHIEASLHKLISHGGKLFLVLNLPDPSKIPYTKENGTSDRVRFLAEKHNQKLATMVAKLQQQNPQIKIVLMDTFKTFNDVIADPDKINIEYKTHIKNTVDACWNGNYLYHATQSLKDGLKSDLSKSLSSHLEDMGKLDNMAETILQSPELLETYRLTHAYQQGKSSPCANPDELIFWDTIHPSAVVHHVLSQIVVKVLNNQKILPQ